MSREKMLAAQQLIKEKHYPEARAILRTVDNPTAREWLAKLDNLERPSANRRRVGVLVVLLVIVLLAMGVIAFVTIKTNSSAAAAEVERRFNQESTDTESTREFCKTWRDVVPYADCLNGTRLPPTPKK